VQVLLYAGHSVCYWATQDIHKPECRIVSVNGEDGLDCFMHLNVTANGKPVDATQELLAMGLCNIGNSLVQGFPGSGSLSRSAVNNSSGVRTPLGGLYTGMLSTMPGNHKVLEIELF
jgi:F0F1-type ATP synthase membrane subunit c/vacuolar-type H+-ATPase subunit K